MPRRRGHALWHFSKPMVWHKQGVSDSHKKTPQKPPFQAIFYCAFGSQSNDLI
jgi:hypothetical protein